VVKVGFNEQWEKKKKEKCRNGGDGKAGDGAMVVWRCCGDDRRVFGR
jgi:hypothetical protein